MDTSQNNHILSKHNDIKSQNDHILNHYYEISQVLCFMCLFYVVEMGFHI